jgi:hypothetical protein
MWAKISEEMGVPWRAAEAMHWQLGEKKMARRAGVIPFAFANAGTETNMRQFALQRNPSYNYAASNQMSMGTSSSAHLYCQDPSYRRHLDLPRANLSRTNLPFPTSGIGQVGGSGTHLIQHAAGTSGGYENQQNLPGIAEILSGVSSYKTPPFSMSAPLSSLPSYTATSPLTSPTRSTWIDHSSNSDREKVMASKLPNALEIEAVMFQHLGYIEALDTGTIANLCKRTSMLYLPLCNILSILWFAILYRAINYHTNELKKNECGLSSTNANEQRYRTKCHLVGTVGSQSGLLIDRMIYVSYS